MKASLILAQLALSLSVTSAFGHDVGFTQTTLKEQDRDLHITLWYPTVDQSVPIERVAENIAFEGIDVRKNAKSTQPEPAPLVLLSHGYRGSWRNLNWLAAELVKSGYVVAAPDHPGTTTFNTSPEQAAKWWARPQDMSRTLNWLLEQPAFSDQIDSQRIAAIGHSMGGWTVINLAGGEMDAQHLANECQKHENPRVCELLPEMGLDKPTNGKNQLKDGRFKAVVSLDLGLARGFSPESLNSIDIQVLVQAAGTNTAQLPHELESDYLASAIPSQFSHYERYEDATHFSFMQICKPAGRAIIEEEHKGDGIVCDDGNQRSRHELHKAMSQSIIQFLETAFSR
ncbi:alpha/beta fold hydrolase [Vibrio sp. SCSIO 43132]|uniref:alpha/beta hydrolase family protein n=1 Tax=Vibrio sp. SCSIO 43132 TaxID=2779363 RepID=UPI001CA943AC|nr:alpha/beta fold hydrolase [Vibrio sp. SCSIO 43132]UAB72886.1 alpha/beta fold hydrolase [Vibrio sp. SCSIO 43132]